MTTPDKLDLAELREKADWVIEWLDGVPGMPPPEIEEVVRAVSALIKRVEDAETERAATQSQADAEAAEVDSLLLRLSATEAERGAAQSALAAAQKRITALMQGGGICGLCNGTGKFKGEDCGACDGVGVPVLSRIASVIEDRDRFDRQRREFSNALATTQKRIAELEALISTPAPR